MRDQELDHTPDAEAAARRRRSWRRIGVFLVAALAVVVAVVVPIPLFYVYLPGPAPDAERLVEVVNTNTYSSDGQFILTTVSVDTETTLFELAMGFFDPNRSVVLKEQVTGGQSLERLKRLQRREMVLSKRHAREVVLTTLGLGRPKGDGALVVDVVERSPAEGAIRPDDVIVSMDGRRVSTTCDVATTMEQHEPGDDIDLVVRRDGRTRSVEVEAGVNPNDPGAAFLGVAMRDVDYRFDADVEVTFKTGRIAGPSAGLMMALAFYDRITPDDLTGGRKIAGTGTIACDGDVGPIGGIEQKVFGAEARGADVFLAPSANAAAARRAADDIDVVATSSFDDALEYLEGLE